MLVLFAREGQTIWLKKNMKIMYMNLSNFFYANVVFLNNYSDLINGGYHWLDQVAVGEKILTPPSLKRGGYNFLGWFLEPEGINQWDFDEVLDSTDKILKLYAKWD